MRLPDDEKFYSIKQMRTRYIIVSTGKQLEFFDILTMTRIGKLEIGNFYSVIIRANPPHLRFEMDDIFLQEACIGYLEGAFFKTAIICRIEEGSDAAA